MLLRIAPMLLLACLGLVLFTCAKSPSESIPTITKEQLKRSLNDPNVVVIDVRVASHWTESYLKVKGAVHEDPTMLALWLNKYPKGKMIVFY